MKRKRSTAYQCFLHCGCTDKGNRRYIKNSRVIEWLVYSAGLQAPSEKQIPCCQSVKRKLEDKKEINVTLESWYIPTQISTKGRDESTDTANTL